MKSGLLIDTCALVWLAALAEGDQLGPAADALDEARLSGRPVVLSPISAWEIGMLAAKGRLPMSISPRAWLESVMRAAGLAWAAMPVEVLLASSVLPGHPHGDPADRIIVATAREYGLRVVTRDRAILSYAAQGHVLAVAC
jgi:PIN domain nuclease of toxin-antitoxin system